MGRMGGRPRHHWRRYVNSGNYPRGFETHVEASGRITLTSASSITEPPKRVMTGTLTIYLPFSASHPA